MPKSPEVEEFKRYIETQLENFERGEDQAKLRAAEWLLSKAWDRIDADGD